MATLFAIDPESKTDHLIGVCTSQSECIELIQQSLDPLLIFISGRLDDGSGISLINAIHDVMLTTSGEDHITVLTLNTVNPSSLKEALDSNANIVLTQRGFETLTIQHVLYSVKNKINSLELCTQTNENLMPKIIDAARAECTLGEISDAMRKSFGEYK